MDAKELLLDMQESHKTILLDILDRLVPAGLEVWAFGSRARWTARETSDLDLVLRNPAQLETRLDAGILDDLKEAFEESDLPFMVDLLDWATVSEKFRTVIEREYVVVQHGRGGEMLAGWKRIRLEDAIEFRNGKTSPERSETGSNPIFGGNGIIGYTEKSNSNGETIVVGRVGAYCGSLYYHYGNCWVTDNAIIAIAKSGSNSKFYYYLLKNIDLNNYRSGSSQPLVNQSALNQIEVKVPREKSTQHRIAAILSSLDEKIELNRQTNQTLEAIAQALFKEWFVDFNFPSATGEMQESELGPIPVGWRVGKVGDVCAVNKKALSKNDGLEWIEYIEISGVNKGVVNETTRYDFGKEPSRAKRKLTHGDTVLSTVRPDRGSYFLAINPPSSHIASTGFAIFSTTQVPFVFLYLFLTDPEKLEYYGHVAAGGAYPAINPNLIMDIDIIIPDEKVLREFHSITESMFEKMHIKNEQSKQLSQLRDTLLPELMNGEIAV